MNEERTASSRPLLVTMVVVVAVAALWAATALAGRGTSTPPNSAPAGDGPGSVYVKDRGGAASRHHGSDAGSGKCRNRSRAGASAAV